MHTMELDRTGLEVLDRDECLRLLALATLGRIGFTSGALPMVLPIDFHLDGERIVVRAAQGSMLDAALHNSVVAFEVDNFDAISHAGWSVAVTGLAAKITDQNHLDQVRQQRVAHTARFGDDVVIAISTELMSGRRTIAETRPVRG
jgi:nitroimidazol reductase NimA-like FMN-containing flavoprotein (pyridoxamine 5'-phosphate oxidase superfamily)